MAPTTSQTPVRPRAQPAAPPTFVGGQVQGLGLQMGRCNFLSYALGDSQLVAADDLLAEGPYVEIWERAMGELHSRLWTSEDDRVSRLALAPDGRTLAIGYPERWTSGICLRLASAANLRPRARSALRLAAGLAAGDGRSWMPGLRMRGSDDPGQFTAGTGMRSLAQT